MARRVFVFRDRLERTDIGPEYSTLVSVDLFDPTLVVKGAPLEVRTVDGVRHKTVISMVHDEEVTVRGLPPVPPFSEAWLDDGTHEDPSQAVPIPRMRTTTGRKSTRDEIKAATAHEAFTLGRFFEHRHFVTAPCPICGAVLAREASDLPSLCLACRAYMFIEGETCHEIDLRYMTRLVPPFGIPLAVLPPGFRLPALCAYCGAPPVTTRPVQPYPTGGVSNTGFGSVLAWGAYLAGSSAASRMASPGQHPIYDTLAGKGASASGPETGLSFPVCGSPRKDHLWQGVSTLFDELVFQSYGYYGATVTALLAAHSP